ncbi:uncharacterized protein N7518_007060 [Penicillium psychrosexuale]|uniref:uncharacterized protein n=1 Tax=Penicillium psychrosexuale TaxID=1002107 RepID=UPI0025459D1B|nr:uncharacterized protein N7518_007060 [Penicillium psychrosexuale]KAJ5790049.1 hypothetical protein N7518_007060 [Penicillium psychrosexuale]
MSSDRGTQALAGEEEWISIFDFNIPEDMIMEFEGRSCNIFDDEKNVVDKLGYNDGKVSREVKKGWCCYVLKAKVKFSKCQE